MDSRHERIEPGTREQEPRVLWDQIETIAGLSTRLGEMAVSGDSRLKLHVRKTEDVLETRSGRRLEVA